MSNPTCPFRSPLMDIKKDWIDYNGHLNMAYYNVLFDQGSEYYLEYLGLGKDYIKQRNLSIYTAEIHVCYIQEVHLKDQLHVETRILDHDEKRLHTFAELYHKDGWLSATCETMYLHVDMSGPKVSAFPDDILTQIQAQAKEHGTLPAPSKAGRRIEITRKATA